MSIISGIAVGEATPKNSYKENVKTDEIASYAQKVVTHSGDILNVKFSPEDYASHRPQSLATVAYKVAYGAYSDNAGRAQLTVRFISVVTASDLNELAVSAGVKATQPSQVAV